MISKLFKQKIQFIKSSLKFQQNTRSSFIQNIQFQSRRSFCSLDLRPQILKNSIKLGNDASKGQQIQKNLQEEFSQIENISNPQHQNRIKKIIQTFIVNTDFVSLEQLAEFIALDDEKLLQKLTSMGINPEKISLKEANLISLEYDVKIQHKNEKGNIKQRSPVVTIMGHVDHGKTTLLDYLRNSQIAKGEFGGITQKIGAFHVMTPEGQRITFIDTPGHEAFSNMRVRGANSTDMIILVVSAIEGIQPQTLEVIKLAHQNQVHMLVAINKIDVPGARPDLVEKQLKEQGKLDLEPFGGNIPVVHISALNELILFESELMELQEKLSLNFVLFQDYDSLAEGVVIESRRDVDSDEKSCTIIVQKGTLKVGDHIIIGNNYCKVRSIKDDKKNILKQAYPSYAVEILKKYLKQTGIKELPQSGDVVFALESENKAKVISQRRIKNDEELNNQEEQFIQGSGSKLKFENVREKRKFFSGNREITEAKYNEVESRILEKIKQLEQIDFKTDAEMNDIQQKIKKLKQDLLQNKQYMANLVGDVKANDFGTKETLVSQILKAKQGYEDIQLNIISATVGQVTEADIRDAELFNAKVLGMDIQLTKDVEQLVKQKNIVVKSHKIIYTLIDDIKLLMEQGPEEGEIEEKEVERGQAVIQSVIEIKASKSQTQYVAGCKVLSGKINKKHLYRVERDGEVIEKDLEIANLRHFKKEVEEIKEGSECGIIFFRFNSFEEGDTVVAYEKE